MIQRIQTLYLLLITIAMAVMIFFSPMCYVTPEESMEQSIYNYDLGHLHEVIYDVNEHLIHVPDTKIMPTWALSGLVAAIGALALVCIFLYRNRILQARLCVLGILLCIGYYIVLTVYSVLICKMLSVDWYVEWSASLPLVALVLYFLAARSILADEALVRAADRIR